MNDDGDETAEGHAAAIEDLLHRLAMFGDARIIHDLGIDLVPNRLGGVFNPGEDDDLVLRGVVST